MGRPGMVVASLMVVVPDGLGSIFRCCAGWGCQLARLDGDSGEGLLAAYESVEEISTYINNDIHMCDMILAQPA